MFKLAVISDEVSQDLEVVAKFADRHKLDAIEIRSVWNKPPQELVSKVSDIKAILRKYDLAVSDIASPFFKADIDSEEEYKKHIEILKDVISLAKSLDTNIIRGFIFWRKGEFIDYIDKIVERFQEPLDIISDEGVILAIENEPSTFATNARLVVDFLNRVKHKNLGAVWDPGNDLGDPYEEVPYPDGYNIIKPYMIHVHIKDGKKIAKEKVEFVPVGEGDVDYLSQIIALLKDNYKGYVSLETHWRVKGQLDKELAEKPGGEAFSSMGELSSDICMKNLKKIIEKALEKIK
ncbi:MAG: sugar phosphate isomerase/epimerase [Thermoproteales archaeon]|nr:sugar phosphate isomerase/epimerase [Thermoproteales archaeon]